MRLLLERAGFRVHGRRADCVHCRGGSPLTVSFNDEVAFCHRCKWTANATQLARAQGRTVPKETESHKRARVRAEQFARWVDLRGKKLAAGYRQLGIKAALAKRILVTYPDCEPAWDALARFYHNEARLAGALDSLSEEKVSRWDTLPLTKVFDAWELAHAS